MNKVHIPQLEDFRDLHNLTGIVYTFMSEDGRVDMSYAQYLNDIDLRAKMANQSRYKLILGRTIFTYDMEWLKHRSHAKIVQSLRNFEEDNRANPLRFFAPSGQEALDFLNSEEDVSILISCNRFGKTQTMLVKLLIYSIHCDPNWEIFSKYGVKYVPWHGAVKSGLASYELDSHQKTILPMLLDWLPKDELGVYARDYKGKGAKQVTLRVDPRLPLHCGTEIGFYSTTQDQAKFESSAIQYWGWDEQGSEEKFVGANERTRTTSANGKHFFGLTPHKIDGRPDTGAGSWIQNLFEGTKTYGLTVSRHHGEIWDVSDWIYPEVSKEKAFFQWVIEPTINGDDKALREGRSRFFGEFHESSGLVIDEFDSTKHVIEPFDIPSHWPRFRAVDHGSASHPMACLWGAISPAGDLFIYRDYLRKGMSPKQNAAAIVEASGNGLNAIGRYEDPKSGLAYDRLEEICRSESYQWTVFDARSYSQKSTESNLTLSKLYNLHGLKMKQGSGADCRTYVPILKDWFSIDKNKQHFVTKELGAPRVYIFCTCTRFLMQFKRWVWQASKKREAYRKVHESPKKKDDDLCDCLKLMIQAQPRFRGGVKMGDSAYYDIKTSEESILHVGRSIDPLTGY